MASISNELILYNNVQEGKIKLDRLTDEGLKAYRRGEAEFKASSSPMSKKKKEKKISAVPAEGDMFAPLPSGAFSRPLPSRSTTPTLPKVDMQKAFQEASRVVPPTPVSEGATPFEKQKFNEQSAKYLGKQLQDQPIYTGTPPVQAKAGTIVKGTPENVKARQQVLKQKQEFENTAKEFEKQVIENNKTIPQRIKETLSDAKELAKTNPSLAYEQLARGVVNAASLGLIDRLVMEERAKELDKLTGKQGQAVRDIGQMLGIIAPYGAAVSATGKLGKVIAPLTPKLAQTIGKSPIRYEAAREAAASGALNLATQAAEAPFVDRTPAERLGSFATDVGLGGAFGAVGGAITKGIGKLSSPKVAEVPSAPKVEEPPIVEQAPVTPKSKPEQKQNILDQIEEILKVQNKDRLDKIIPDEASWKKATRQQKLEHNQNANLPNAIKSTENTWRKIAKTIEENNLDMRITEDLVRKVGTDSKLQIQLMMEIEKEIAKAKGISKPTAPIRTYEEVTVNDITKKITKEINDLQIKFDDEIAAAKKAGAKTAPITRKYNKQIKELDAQRKAEQDRLWKDYTSNAQLEADTTAPKPESPKEKDVTLDNVEDVMNKRNDAIIAAEQAKLGIVPSASAVTGGRFDISKTALQASDPLVEQALTSTRSRTNRLVQRAKEMFNLAVEGMSKFKPFVALANPVREILYTGDRQLQKVPDLVERQLRTVFKPLTGTDAQKAEKMDLIARTILARDLDETVKADPSADLPFEANPAEIAKQRAEYERLIQAYPDVRAVLDNYENLMQAQFNTMVKLGVITPDKARVNYYPHRVLEYTSELTYGGGKKLDTPYRWNTMKRKGYKGAIDAAVVDVLRDVLIKSHSDNIIQKTLNDTLKKVDVLHKVSIADVAKQVSPEAAQLLKPYGQQYGIFSNRMGTILSSLGVPDDELDLIVKNLWKDSKQHPKIQSALIDEKGFKYNGEDYVFFNPRYTSDVYLIPKAAADHMADFGKPLGTGIVWQAASGLTGFFKRWALTITAPARIPYDAFSNMGKLLRHDPRALAYIPTALRISLQRLDGAKARKLSALITKIINKEKIKLDSETRRLAISEGVVEPRNITRGVYSFTPTWEKTLRRGLNLTGISGNTTQAVDEFFRLVKLSADVDRIKKGKMVKSAGIIDVEDLTPMQQASKVAQEFFVDPRRQSRFMRKWFTMGGFMPFLNWFAVDILHTMRSLKNNPKKELAYLAALVAGYELWNNTGERKKIEQQLTPEKRQIPHLITGYADDEGKPYIVYFGGLAGSTLYQSTGASFVPQAASDVLTGQKTVKEALSQTAEKARQTVVKTPTSMLAPAVKLPAELILNKSFFTDKPIYPQLGSLGQRLEQGSGYAATQLIPQIRSFQSESKKLAEEKTGEETLVTSVLDSLQNVFNPTKRFIKAEDLDKLGQLMDYEKLRKQYGITSGIKEKLIPAIAKYLETEDATEVRQLMAESKLSNQAISAFIRSSQKDILREQIKNSDDPALIITLREKLNEIEKLDRQKLKQKVGE